MKYGKPLNEDAGLVSKKLGAVRTTLPPVHFAAQSLAIDTLLHPHLRVEDRIFKPDIIGGHQRRGHGVAASRRNVVVGEQRRRVTAVAWNGYVLCVTKMLN